MTKIYRRRLPIQLTLVTKYFLTFILSFGVILPSPVSLGFISIAHAESCSNGLIFNSVVGRCLSSEQASQVAQAASQCESLSTPDAKKQCYVDAAEGRLNDAVSKGEVSNEGKLKTSALSTALVLAGLGSSVTFLATKKGCPGATSAILIAGGSVSVLAGEVLAKRQYKKKIKQAQEKLKSVNDSSKGTTSSTSNSDVANGTNAQAEAFDALIMQEDALISAAKTKKKLYMLATAAYAGATVLAGVEVFRGTTNPADVNCITKSEQNRELERQENETRLEAERYDTDPAYRAEQDRLVDEEVAAAGDTTTTAESDVILVTARRLGGTVGGFTKLYSKPVTRIALAGLLNANNVYMIGQISKEEKKAKDRKAFLEKLREQVMAAGTAFSCTSADRTNPGNINCYCYGTDGKLNPSRNNSQICSGLFQSQNLAATSYSTGSGEAIPNFCTSNSGALDETCRCRSTNTCLTISGISGNLGANGINLGSIPSSLNAINGGTLNGANLDSESLGGQAAQLKKVADALAQKNPVIAKAAQEGNAIKDKFLKTATNQIGKRTAPSLGLSSGSSDSFLQAKSPEEALATIKQEIGRVESAGASVTGTRSSDDQLNFGLGGAPSGGVTIDEGQLAAVMENSLANGNSDINTSNGNIFQILSNRYQRSGMRRLFGSESLPLENANESDINK